SDDVHLDRAPAWAAIPDQAPGDRDSRGQGGRRDKVSAHDGAECPAPSAGRQRWLLRRQGPARALRTYLLGPASRPSLPVAMNAIVLLPDPDESARHRRALLRQSDTLLTIIEELRLARVRVVPDDVRSQIRSLQIKLGRVEPAPVRLSVRGA